MEDHIDEFLSLYLDNELSKAERENVDAHVRNCPPCAELLADVQAMRMTLAAAFADIEAPDTMETKVLLAIRQDASRAQSKLLRWLWAPTLLALAILVAAASFLGTTSLRLGSIGVKLLLALLYAMGSLLGADPQIAGTVVGVALVLMLASGLSLNRLLKNKPVQGDSL